jgi:hypothetical protein
MVQGEDPEGQSATIARLAKMEEVLDQTVAATRRIASDLRPLMLDDLGLVPAVEWLTETFSERTRIPCELAVDDAELDLPGAQATAVFRIVRNRSRTSASTRGFPREGRHRAEGARISRSAYVTTVRDSRLRRHASRTRTASSACASARRFWAAISPSRAPRARARTSKSAFRWRHRPGVMIRVVIADDHTIVREGLKQLALRGERRRGRR